MSILSSLTSEHCTECGGRAPAAEIEREPVGVIQPGGTHTGGLGWIVAWHVCGCGHRTRVAHDTQGRMAGYEQRAREREN